MTSQSTSCAIPLHNAVFLYADYPWLLTAGVAAI